MNLSEYLYLTNYLLYDFSNYLVKHHNKLKLGYYSKVEENKIILLSMLISTLDDYNPNDILNTNLFDTDDMNQIVQSLNVLLNKHYSIQF